MPLFCFRTLKAGETHGRGYFEYPDSLGKGPGTVVSGVTRFFYKASDVGELNEVQNIHFVIGVHENVSQLNLVAASPDRTRSLTAGPAQPHRLGPVSGDPSLQLEWPKEVASVDECLGADTTLSTLPPAIDKTDIHPAAPEKSSAPPKIVIRTINYHGQVKRTQSDEYVEIANDGGQAASLQGWRLYADDRGQNFIFPEGTMLGPGVSVRVYTNEIHPETGGFSYGSGRAIWNDKGDEAQLFDSGNNLVSRYGYGFKAS